MRLTGFEVTMAVLAAVAIGCLTADQRRHRRELTRARALNALIEATREQPRIEKLPPRTALGPCGCLWFSGGLWSPCRIHDSGLIAAHIDAWESELDQ